MQVSILSVAFMGLEKYVESSVKKYLKRRQKTMTVLYAVGQIKSNRRLVYSESFQVGI